MVKKLIEDNQNNKIDAGWTLLSLACNKLGSVNSEMIIIYE